MMQTTVISQQCLPYGIIFTTQMQIDSFQINYPNCSEIEGDVFISGSNISDLQGLNVVTSVRALVIEETDSLQNLIGLENLITIRGTLEIWNTNSLQSLEGLENISLIGGGMEISSNALLESLTSFFDLDSIGFHLNICHNAVLTSLTGLNINTVERSIYIENNPSLTSLSALENITSIGGSLFVVGNALLENLNGLDNIAYNSITKLRIMNNTTLSNCAVKSICEYLADPNGTIEIQGNSSGCNNQTEVEEECIASIPKLLSKNDISIYPNPAKGEIFVLNKEGIVINKVTIFNQLGQSVLHQIKTSGNIDISILGQGMYIIELTSNKFKIRNKLIIQ